MNSSTRIFIVGHPGAGKALLAKTIAERLGWHYIDADTGLEYFSGLSMNEMLGELGTKNFLNCQKNVLTSLLKREHIVVTTDATIACHDEISQLLSDEHVIYLQVNLPIQMKRLAKSQQPFLLDDMLEKFLQKLHVQRNHLYEKMATLKINSNDHNLEAHVDSVLQLLASSIDKPSSALNITERCFYHKQSHELTQLTEQQANCLKLLAQGKTSKEIAKRLSISFRTVEANMAKIMQILGCSSSKELIALYHQKP
ncbi:shikimate kinase [Legionella lytica]|uniref:Shikimate kinase n=1 Tax=Legionella lytica TaxID=96232 RepID=A0ABY4Y7E3_9GAMM|nr:shikimate kinase [Legionella lytica]USQ13459.1 shikimate kinase [Legionella lytica]